MSNSRKKSLSAMLESVRYVPNRTPEMSVAGGASEAFRRLADYRDGAIYVGHYSGSSEWERHPNGDEIVMALSGSTSIILRVNGEDERIELGAEEMIVVPCNTWHRFENATELKVLTVTPQPTDHSLDDPGA